MDPNLETIRNANIKLITRGKLSVPVMHAKNYLFTILGEDRKVQVQNELNEFVNHLKELKRKQS